ncbi:MAG: hypothetical protein SAK42_23195, partial [Oscillatoria sp. PMC 1076.18]|nr:hypothetical protein [Oscillatoria sp. PMC 1076.18]
FTEYKYERWDATVRDESGKIRAYIESKVRYLKSTQHRSAIVGKAKKALTKLNDAPVLVISWYKQDDKVYVFPFVQNGKLSPYIIEDQQYLILPEEQSWVYSYKNRNLELLSYPPKTA